MCICTIYSRKRKHEDDFESSVMTTSTPETQNATKRPRISLSKPFFMLSKTTGTKAEEKPLKKRELPVTSSDTSDKEDYIEDDEISGNSSIKAIKPRNFKSMVKS